ncbi:uncharacterized protein LOC130900619 isoform X1 [Diorhabda carinulata]|uniref:uncharacterized protein LOC130900619 isoform X1 n=1 Tax=Diorhabda carinulata TaxID=1163345 RepID=UPI00259FFB3B|nr:uncharacterized protein LOC130900619 isoform X1 [Diorhabda carinulata]
MNILYFLLLIVLIEARGNNWVDPHEMKINVKSSLKRSQSENDKSSNILKEPVYYREPSVDENMPLIYLKRTVKLILQAADRSSDNSNEYTGTYKYDLDSEEYKFLINFADNKITNNEDIRKLDTVLSMIFSTSYKNNILNFGIGIKDQLLNYTSLIFFGIAICFYTVYKLLKNNSGFWSIISYLIFLLLIVDYGYRYRFMYEEMEEHNMKVIYTTACDSTKMNWSQYFQFLLKKNDCEKRMVTPLDVGLNQLKHIIIIPLESFGTGMGKFSKELWETLPFPWNFFIFPIILVLIIGIIFIFMLTSKNTLKLKLCHLFHFEAADGNRVSGEILEKLLDAAIHKRVEDIRSFPVKREPKIVEYKNDNSKEYVINGTKEESVSESTDNANENKIENTSTNVSVEDKKEK